MCLDQKKATAKKPASAGGFGAAPKKTKPKEAESTPEQRQRLDFMDWVSAAGGAVDAVRLADCGGGLRGLKATRDLKKGEVIVRIPRSIILDVERAEACAVSSIWRGAADEIPGYVKIGLAVLYEQRRGAESDLRPYLELLPSRADFERDGGPAALWSDAELAVTECGGLIESAKRRRRQSYAADMRALQPAALAARWTELGLPGEPPTTEELSWAVTVVTSRAYGVGSGSGLVPVVDMANHDGRYPQHTAKGLEEDGKTFVVLATERIKEGAQVCLTYGNLANLLLLPQFGFVLPSLTAPPDIALVDCAELLEDVRRADGGAARLDELAEDGLLMREGDGRVSRWQSAGAPLQAALLSLAEAGALSTAEAGAAAGVCQAPGSGWLAWGAYKKALSTTLSGYSTSVAQDREALGTAPVLGSAPLRALALPPRARLAREFRLSQKVLLNQALAANEAAGSAGIREAAARLRMQVQGARVYEAALAEEGAIVTGSGLVLVHEVEGTGASPSSTDEVTVHYEGETADEVVFDSSYERGKPMSFAVTGVIGGWTEGLQLMKVGGKARLTIPSHLGYGDKGSPPKIPPKATLTFTVELLGIKDALY
jgi:FKBP-type peptidyl-prolyl cis-trans isomerase